MGRRRREREDPRLGPSSFDELYARHQHDLVGFFARRTFDPEAAVDLVGETFAQAFAGRRRFRGRTAEQEAAFLFAIGRHLLAQYFRRGRVERHALERLGVDRPALDDQSIEAIEHAAGVAPMRAIVRDQLAALSAEHREALQLRIVDELPYPAVADRLGVSEPTARARVSRALRALDAGLPDAVREEWAT